MRFHFIPTRMDGYNQNPENNTCGEKIEKANTLWECEVAQPCGKTSLWEKAGQFCSKLDTKLPCEWAIPPTDIPPKAWKPSTQTNTCL